MSEQDVTAGKLLVTEYEALKREQVARIGTRDNLAYATLAAMGLIVAAGMRESSPASLLLLLPPVVLVLGWTRIANDVKVTHIARYLRCEVAPRFVAITGESALGWEHAHRADSRRRLRMACQAVADLVLFVAAPLAALGLYWHDGPWTLPLLAVSVGEALLVAGLAAVITAYSGLFDHPCREGRAVAAAPITVDETWDELVTAAVHEVFPMGVADVIVQADAFTALVCQLRNTCQRVDATPCDVLREIDEGDQWLAGRVDEPAAFLAAKVRGL